MRARYCMAFFVVIMLLGVACGKSGSSANALGEGEVFIGISQPIAQERPGLATSLPPVGNLKAGSALTELTIDGADTRERNNAFEDNSILYLENSSGELSWGMWEISTADEPQFVTVNMNVPLNDEAWIALADFLHDRWEFFKPSGNSQQLDFDLAKHTSEDGSIFIAVLVHDGNEAAVISLEVTVYHNTNTRPVADLVIDAGEERGNPPHMVNFDASGSSDADGSIVEYAWDFDGDGSFDALTSTATIAHTYTQGGSYTALVRVEDDDFARDTAAVEISVNAAPVADLTADVSSADPPFIVSFDASGSADADGSIVDYEWDLDGDGEFNETGDEADARGTTTANTEYTDPGLPLAAVRVTDSEGLEDIAQLQISSRGWAVLEVGKVHGGGGIVLTTSLAVIDGYPAVCFSDVAAGCLKYRISDTPTGWRPEDWGPVLQITESNQGVVFVDMVELDACPAIVFSSTIDETLSYTRSLNSSGRQISDWIVPVPLETWVRNPDLCVVEGCPAIAYYDSETVKYARSTNSIGASISDWTVVPLGYAAQNLHFSLAVINGNPAIAYRSSDSQSNMTYTRSTTATGMSASDWITPVIVDSALYGGTFASLAEINGCPAVIGGGSTSDLQYTRATTASGANAADWSQVVGLGDGSFNCLTTVNGKPAISTGDTGLKYIYSSTETGSSAADWTEVLVDNVGNPGVYGTTVIEVNGSVAISYHRDTAPEQAMYAYLVQ